MNTLFTKPLIACTTNEQYFSTHVEAAANEIGSDFCASENLDSAFRQCNNRLSCVVIDYENSFSAGPQSTTKSQRDARPMIFVIPEGDVNAAFRAASVGAVNVIEKPNLDRDLIVNLRTALASESRMAEARRGENRFTNPKFEILSQREKAILGLLMEGEPNKRVASILDVGLRTVEAERAQVIKKMKSNSFVELIRMVSCIENDLSETRKSIFGSILPR
jgi:FixJ family two-component response regulator